MLSKEVLEAQETVEMPAREMMNWNGSAIFALQGNANAQLSAFCSANVSSQGNLISVSQGN